MGSHAKQGSTKKALSMSNSQVLSFVADPVPGASGVATDLESHSQEGPSAGALIRQARESAGLHIAALAVALKVPVKKLEALEADRFDLLPDAVFVRALASSVCRNLRVSAAPVLARLPQTNTHTLSYKGTGINAPFRATSDGPGPSVWAQVSKSAALAGLVLLMGALILIFLPSLRANVDEANADSIAKGARSILPSTATPASAGDLGARAVAELKSTANAVDQSSMVAQPGIKSGDTATSAAITVNVITPVLEVPGTLQMSETTGALASAAAPTFSKDVIVFIAKSESWVEVTDSKGIVVLRRILSAGETVGASGALPLVAVVGRADATQVKIRGKAFDLIPLAKDNVARFEVK